MKRTACLIVANILAFTGVSLSDVRIPRALVSDHLLPTFEKIQPAGKLVLLANRACDVFERTGQYWVKQSGQMEVINADGTSAGSATSKGGSSQTGLLPSPNGALFTNADRTIHEFGFKDGKFQLLRDIDLPSGSFPNGMTWLRNGKTFLVCLSKRNLVVVVDYASGQIVKQYKTDAAPYQVLVVNGKAVVSCQGGRIAGPQETRAKTVETEIPVDDEGRASGGVVDAIDLTSGDRTICEVGLQPGPMLYLAKSKRLVVANANDDTLDFIDCDSFRSVSQFETTIDERLPFGSMPNGLACAADESTLYVSLAGNNAVEVVDLNAPGGPTAKGFIPTAWYPSALAVTGNTLAVVDTQGVGSRQLKRGMDAGRNTWDITGALQLVANVPSIDLESMTRVAKASARLREMISANELAGAQVPPVPVPAKVGDPSLFNHVLYVIKENRTYDQVFGDIKTGDGDARLCTFGEKVTPNQHALARRFTLLDNYYCSGVCSADGHAWAIEGNVTPYLAQEFGQGARSYDYGTDPITYSSSGFLWDQVLAQHKTFRNFGELDFPTLPDGWKLADVWRAYEKGNKTEFGQRVDIERLRRHTSREYPGWEMAIPDVLRMDRFLTEFHTWERRGTMPNLVIVYLPQDHTAGTNPGYPTPSSYVADNDLALGRLVDALSHSTFWKDTVVFSNEDDPQNGYDHIDGHRSTCVVASPYTKRRVTVSDFYNQDSVLHTILRIFGCPAMNQKVAIAPLMTNCFSEEADMSPYNALDPDVDRKKLNPPLSALRGEPRRLAIASARQNLRHPDSADVRQDDAMNRALWSSVKGGAAYPTEFAGAHGKGLRRKGLRLDGGKPALGGDRD